jgi:uncharacterized paraquat-inducible protein A
MMKGNEWQTAVCPECGHLIKLASLTTQFHLLLCPHCEMLLVVTAVCPLRLDWAFEEPDDSKNNFNPYFPRPIS